MKRCGEEPIDDLSAQCSPVVWSTAAAKVSSRIVIRHGCSIRKVGDETYDAPNTTLVCTQTSGR